MKFRNKRAGKQQQKNQTKVCKHAKRLNSRYCNVCRDENPRIDKYNTHALAVCFPIALKEWGKTLDYGSCFPQLSFRA